MGPGNSPDTTPSLEGSPQRITPQDVEKAKQEKKVAMTKLLDDMEASVSKQGQYFIELGQKKPISEMRPVTTSKFMGLGSKTTEQQQVVGYEDNRALILKAPIIQADGSSAGRVDFLVITKDGIFRASFWKSEIDDPRSGNAQDNKRKYDTLINLTTGEQTTDGYGYAGSPEGPYSDRPRIAGPNYWLLDLDNTADEGTRGDINKDFPLALRQSIEMTESPYKKQVDQANAQIQTAANASNIINSLPPRG